jgi:dolichol-phosphate mannosyltransferase
MRVLIGLPVYNERRPLVAVLDRLAAYGRDVLVVDDGSTDGTAELLAARSGVAVLSHRENLGYGRSLANLFDAAIRGEYQWLITIDGDLQHDTDEIPLFLAAAEKGDADIVSGTRYATAFDPAHPPPVDRRRINVLITEAVNVLLGLNLTDAFCGYKAYRVAALRRLDPTEPRYAMPLQVWVQAVRRGLRIVELPVRLIYLDAFRHFGGEMDDTAERLRYYLTVLLEEMAREDRRPCRGRCPEAAAR